MFFRPNPSSGVPIYLQLIEQVKHAIETGALAAGEQLPGIRTLAETMAMNHNTVAKAYRELEVEGYVELRHGAGAYVTGTARRGVATARLGELVTRTVEKLRDAGLDESEIRRLVENELTRVREATPPGKKGPHGRRD